MEPEIIHEAILGGRVLGEGGQACIFYPALFGPSKNAHVTKLTTEADAKSEYKISQMLKAIDTKSQYGIYASSMVECNLRRGRIYTQIVKFLRTARNPETSRCGRLAQLMITNGAILACAVNYPKYLHDLDAPLRANMTRIAAGFTNLCRGLEAMHAHNIIHGDIKEANVGVTKTTFKFADFGFAYKLSDCESINTAFARMYRDRRYVPEQYGGDYGIRTPLIWNVGSDCAQRRDVLLFNDIFMLAFMFQNLIENNGLSWPTVFATCQQVFYAGRPGGSLQEAKYFTASEFTTLIRAAFRRDL